jgi:formamidopyrimidine-DNA glycosylase
MPELPEVHTVASDLKKHIVGFTIKKAAVAEKYIKITDKQQFINNVMGRTFTDVQRIAKNILVALDDGNYLHIHLAMTGQVYLLEPDQVEGRKAHVTLHLARDDDHKVLIFHDTRMFGRLVHTAPNIIDQLTGKYGTEPIARNIDMQALYQKLKNRKIAVKSILLDQHLITGLGNIYATEALYLAGIHPLTPMKNISYDKFVELMSAAKKVLEQGIKHRGSTLPDKSYVDIFGEFGTQQEHFNVYLQRKCRKCGSEISYMQLGGRGTYFCPTCQALL